VSQLLHIPSRADSYPVYFLYLKLGSSLGGIVVLAWLDKKVGISQVVSLINTVDNEGIFLTVIILYKNF